MPVTIDGKDAQERQLEEMKREASQTQRRFWVLVVLSVLILLATVGLGIAQLI